MQGGGAGGQGGGVTSFYPMLRTIADAGVEIVERSGSPVATMATSVSRASSASRADQSSLTISSPGTAVNLT